MSDEQSSAYRDNPAATRYVSRAQYREPKEDFKLIIGELERRAGAREQLSLADLGCGNGALLHFLHQRFPGWALHGFDATAEFIDTARAHFGNEPGIALAQRDYTAVTGSYDIVVATCFLSLFRDIEPPLNAMLKLCKPGGLVLATGLFNRFPIEVRVEFCDNSSPATAGRWRTDFNRHSQQSIRDLLEERVETLEFVDGRYDIDIPPDPAHPIRVWSEPLRSGDTLLVNGAWQIANQTLLVARKSS